MGLEDKGTIVSVGRRAIILFAVCVLLGVPVSTNAVGISPPQVIIPSILPGTQQQQRIHVTRSGSDGKDAMTISVHVEGDTTSSIEALSSIVIASNEPGVDYQFFVAPPVGTPEGAYQAALVFSVDRQSPSGTGTTSRVIVGAKARVGFTVSKELVSAIEILDVRVDNSRYGAPMTVRYTANNKGNTPWRPDEIELTFVDRRDSTSNKRLVVPGSSFAEVPAGSLGAVVAVSVSPALDAGEYRVIARFYHEGKIVGEKTSWVFTVSKPVSFTPMSMVAAASILLIIIAGVMRLGKYRA